MGAYAQQSYRGTPWYVGGGVLALVLVRMLALPLLGMTTTPTRASIEKELLGNRMTGALYATLKRTYPAEYDGLVAQRLALESNGQRQDKIEEATLTYLIAAGQRHGTDLIQAPHSDFATYREAEIGVVESLRDADVGLCDQYLTAGGFRTATIPAPFNQKRLIDYRRITWEAKAAGRDRPAGRPIAGPTRDDLRLIAAGMAAQGLTRAEVISYFEGERSMAMLSPSQRCEIGIDSLKAIDKLPGDRSDAIYGFMIAQRYAAPTS